MVTAKKTLAFLMLASAIFVGISSWIPMLQGGELGFLKSKSKTILESSLWKIGFYIHFIFGSVALLTGWIGFVEKMQSKHLKRHRIIGRIYVLTALLSALGGIYISLLSNGGLMASTGFMSLGIIWFYTTIKAFFLIKAKNILEHQKMMIYSYAACFAGVTFRIWTPLFMSLFHDDCMVYGLMAWWCWIPNLTVAYFLIRKSMERL